MKTLNLAMSLILLMSVVACGHGGDPLAPPPEGDAAEGPDLREITVDGVLLRYEV